MLVSVSILSKKDDYEEAIYKINNSEADFLHLDVMDSTFTPSSSFLFEEAKKISELVNKKLDVHIMSSNLEIINDYIKLNPYIITIHSEINNFENMLNIINNNNIKVGLAINPDTSIKKIKKVLDKIDVVLVMSVQPGYGGQTYIKKVNKKIHKLKKIQKRYKYLIEVDGGINDKTINYINNYADIIVSGSFITNSNNYNNQINILKNIDK